MSWSAFVKRSFKQLPMQQRQTCDINAGKISMVFFTESAEAEICDFHHDF